YSSAVRALSTELMNGSVDCRNDSSSNCVSSVAPSVSAVMPVPSETKNIVRRGVACSCMRHQTPITELHDIGKHACTSMPCSFQYRSRVKCCHPNCNEDGSGAQRTRSLVQPPGYGRCRA